MRVYVFIKCGFHTCKIYLKYHITCRVKRQKAYGLNTLSFLLTVTGSKAFILLLLTLKKT